MPHLTKPHLIKETHFTTTTTQGEITVNLNLTLTIEVDESGKIVVSAASRKAEESPEYIPQMPDWEPIGQEDLIDFGKDV